ncbi:site-2 protease family protein [Streptomyces kebangsaanensis]|uniref:site-2 protease family protein n=1 Tax=Streptomyces kebangsaanensis TaxID=864058 RepID=UPI00093F34F0|nr:site-2 protease family protein [Streptomyces kebangsaanensis]
MDVSGGSGQPRSGNDESAERHTGPVAPPPGARPAQRAEDAREQDPAEPPSHTGTTPGTPGATEAEQDRSGTTDPAPAARGAEDREPGAGEPPHAGAPAGPPPRHPDTHPDRAHAHSGQASPPARPKEPGGGLLMGRPFGVPVYVAPSWFLVAALITWVFGGQLDRVLPELGAARYLVSLFFAVAFYASVLVHELAHTIAALRFKLPVRRIQLQFFGGVSEIEKEAETPGREFVLAFVGPLLSLVLAGVFYLAMRPFEPGTVPGVLLAGLMISNLIVAAFNLLPGLPLDGGRMLRAVVWKITGRSMSGTVAAAWVGRALAVAVLIGLPLLTQSGVDPTAEDTVGVGTVTNALLAAILAAIIWTGAGNSLRMARLREHLPELRARTLTRRAVPVETSTSLAEALRRANAAGARALVVVDGHGEPLSLVRESAIAGVPEHRRPWVNASELAQGLTDGMRVSAELAGEDLLDALRATPATEYLVVEETGEIYGVLSAADVERAFVKAMARPSASP